MFFCFVFSNEDIPRCHQRGPNLAKEKQLSLNYSKVGLYIHIIIVNQCKASPDTPSSV